MKIYLIRHGETDWNLQGRLQGREDIALNENGIRQAVLCGQAFQGKKIGAVISSPLVRAKRTAEIIAESIHFEEKVIVEDNLTERDFGRLSGMTYDRRKYFDTFGKDEGIEAWDDLCSRMLNCIKEYAEAYSDKEIIMVSHGAAINAVVSSLTNGESGSGKTRLKNTCINIIQYESGILKLVLFNLTADEFRQLRNSNGV